MGTRLLHRCVMGLLLLAGAASADTHRTASVTELAPGVFTIRHADPTEDFPDGNTTVVVGRDAVLVIDTGWLPSTARADLAEIRRRTDKPVRYVLNTHWHNDHVGGNAVYREAFPGAQFLSHTTTRTMMASRIEPFIRRYVDDASLFGRRRAEQREQLRSGRNDKGEPLGDTERAAIAAALTASEQAIAEFSRFRLQLPTRTFERRLDLDLGGLPVQLRFVGRGNTAGDVVAWLPRQRILVAGDLIDHPVPFAFGGYPSEWIVTLGRLQQLGPRTIVPGHGEVLRDARYIGRVIALLRRVHEEVEAIVAQRGSAAKLEDIQREIDLSAFRREMAGDDPDQQAFFDASMASLVRVTYAEARAR